MEININFDIAALILLFLLCISCIFRKMTTGIPNRIFLVIILNAIASTSFDIFSVMLGNAQSDNLLLLYISNAGYLITHFLCAPLYLLFVISLTDTWHKLRSNLFLQVLFFLPLFAVMAALIANTGNHLVFSVENGYSRGPLFSLLYAATVLYVIYAIAYIIKYRSLFNLGKILSISAIMPIQIISMLIQMLIPSALIEMFGGAVSLLIVSMGIQRPEDFIDSFTRLMKHNAYAQDMKRNFYNNRHTRIIMLNIGNYSALQAIVGYDSSAQVLAQIAGKIRKINKKLHGGADLYYLDHGRFRMVFYDKSAHRAEEVAAYLNQELKKKSNVNGLDISLMPYIVLARCPEEIPDFPSLMSFGADFHETNPYTGQVMQADEVYDRNQLDIKRNIDAIINRALEDKSFQVYYQPIYSTSRKKFASAEALIRLFDPQYGFISPETLITAAEKNGTIHQIGAFVFEEVCRFIASDDFQKLELEYIEVNLSVMQFMNGALPDTLLSIIDQYGIAPDKINLEITETVTAYTQKVMTENLKRLTQAGLSFSLDDYGTGYSNTKRIIQLPLKIVKLDKSFIAEQDNSKMWIFLEHTIKMLKDMDLEIVIEGVETQEMLDAFSNLGCDFIQGYFFSKPVPRNDFVAFISDFNAMAHSC